MKFTTVFLLYTIAYNNGLRRLLNLPKYNSASEMFVNLNIPSFNELLQKFVFSFKTRIVESDNETIISLWHTCILCNEYNNSSMKM